MVELVPLVCCAIAASIARSSSSSAVESTECELTTSRTLTIIKSVRFPEPYDPNVDCRYAVRRRSKSMCSVTFLFNVLDLDPSPECQADYIRFEDTGEKLCGAKPVGFSRTLSFAASKNNKEVVMSFHSGNRTRGGLGYMVTVVQQECPRPSCNSEHTEMEFSLTSPNYPLPYENEQNCRYLVHRANAQICRLSLTVHCFDLEEDEHCDADFLHLDHGNKLCGTLQPGQIVEVDFQNDTLLLEFQSDHVITRNGFQFEALQVECLSSTATDQTNVTAQLPTLENATHVDSATNATVGMTTPLP